MSDNAKVCTILVTVLAFILMLAVALDGLYTLRIYRYVEAGYTQATVPGYNGPIWVKKGTAE